jgi:hypothetical protein
VTRDTYDKFLPKERGLFGDNEPASPKGRVTGSIDLVDLTLVVHHTTERGALLSANGEEARAVWVDLARFDIVKTGNFVTGYRKSGQAVQLPVATVTAPQWLAKEKGLV